MRIIRPVIFISIVLCVSVLVGTFIVRTVSHYIARYEHWYQQQLAEQARHTSEVVEEDVTARTLTTKELSQFNYGAAMAGYAIGSQMAPSPDGGVNSYGMMTGMTWGTVASNTVCEVGLMVAGSPQVLRAPSYECRNVQPNKEVRIRRTTTIEKYDGRAVGSIASYSWPDR